MNEVEAGMMARAVSIRGPIGVYQMIKLLRWWVGKPDLPLRQIGCKVEDGLSAAYVIALFQID
jgi:hypothetical protein